MIKIVADSINWTTHRLTSVVMSIPTCLLAELRTHRLLKWSEDNEFSVSKVVSEFSVNANSDRAIPIKTKLQMVKDRSYLPLVTLANAGMVGIEDVSQGAVAIMNSMWNKSKDLMIEQVEKMLELGASKQYANRLLMPFSWSDVIVTGDEVAWNHFFKLRTTKETEPNLRGIAIEIKKQYEASVPVFKHIGDYHIAFENEANNYPDIDLMDKLSVSGSCCARISYNIEREETLDKHRSRFNLCVNSGHSSISEHQARVPSSLELHHMHHIGTLASNVSGWILLRKLIENKDLVIEGDKLKDRGINHV